MEKNKVGCFTGSLEQFLLREVLALLMYWWHFSSAQLWLYLENSARVFLCYLLVLVLKKPSRLLFWQLSCFCHGEWGFLLFITIPVHVKRQLWWKQFHNRIITILLFSYRPHRSSCCRHHWLICMVLFVCTEIYGPVVHNEEIHAGRLSLPPWEKWVLFLKRNCRDLNVTLS